MTTSCRSAMDSMLRPRSIAVVGASAREGSLGEMVMKKVTGYGFTGKIYPINPKAPEIMGLEAYPQVSVVPHDIDTAVVCVPGSFVIDVVKDLHKKGVPSCIIISAGFKEIGPEGVEREKELKRLAAETGIRIVGPNCFGVINGTGEISLDCTFARNFAPRGHVGFVSQSGAVGAAVNEDLRLTSMGLSLFVTLGNRIDVNENELLEYMAQDDNTRIIIMYLENFADPVRFLEVAREITRKKPIIALKAGKSTHGAAAAASHTGQLAQSDRMVGALLEKAGVIRVSSVGEMIMAAKALYSGVIPEREELAVITNAGGFGVLAIDRAEELGIRLAEFADGTTRALKESLPPEASCKNPVDLLGTATEVQYGTALEWVLKDPGVGGVVYNFGPPVMQKADPIAQKAVEIAARFPGKPVLSIYMNRHRVMEPLRDARGVYVSQFDYPEDAVWAYGKLMEYRSIRNRGREEVPDPPRDREKVAEILKNAAGEGRANLNFDEAQEVLAAYGIPSAKSVVLMPGENPAAKTACLRFPVAIKPNWGGIVHKTEMKAVRLGLQSPGDVEKAAGEISGSISRHTGEAYRGGFVVQEMASDSQEVILGAARQDSGIPLLMFGLGGIFVELLKDVAFAVPPLSEAGADRLIAATKGSLLLEGYRGKPGFARQDARDALVRLSLLIAEHSAIREIDVNPFMVSAEQGKSLAVDVRIIL